MLGLTGVLCILRVGMCLCGHMRKPFVTICVCLTVFPVLHCSSRKQRDIIFSFGWIVQRRKGNFPYVRDFVMNLVNQP